MTIDERHLELINADIDGVITADEKLELSEILANDADARTVHDELRSLCDSLSIVGLLDSPSDLKSSIMNSLPESRVKPASAPQPSGSLLRSLFEAPLLRYAASFAAGIVVTLVLIDSSRLSNGALDDIAHAVGTMSDPSVQSSPIVTQSIDKPEVAGQISLRSSGPLIIVDIDLTTDGPVDVVASYRDQSVWFNGFAQLENKGTQITTADGEIRITADGHRRYALYLHNTGGRDLSVQITFVVDGEPIHETTLNYSSSG